MKKIFFALGLVSAALSLCGFVSGVPSENKVNTPHGPTEPVLQYEETVTPIKSNPELYQQYHLLIVTSLEEARRAIPGDRQWAYRMVHNAYRYVQLQEKVVRTEHQAVFSGLKEKIEPLLVSLKQKNLTSRQQREIDSDLKQITAVVAKELRYKDVAAWIKQ
ncbi:MAG: hypothetical protein PHO30_05765 [Candidatus Omnitrophica bacterium]|jgi:hypothetical protein|nr:hypothetical protein [Candidatus Omnitrophota bacterium]